MGLSWVPRWTNVRHGAPLTTNKRQLGGEFRFQIFSPRAIVDARDSLCAAPFPSVSSHGTYESRCDREKAYIVGVIKLGLPPGFFSSRKRTAGTTARHFKLQCFTS